MTDRSLHFQHHIFRYTTRRGLEHCEQHGGQEYPLGRHGAICEDGGAPGAIEIKAAQDLSGRSYASGCWIRGSCVFG